MAKLEYGKQNLADKTRARGRQTTEASISAVVSLVQFAKRDVLIEVANAIPELAFLKDADFSGGNTLNELLGQTQDATRHLPPATIVALLQFLKLQAQIKTGGKQYKTAGVGIWVPNIREMLMSILIKQREATVFRSISLPPFSTLETASREELPIIFEMADGVWQTADKGSERRILAKQLMARIVELTNNQSLRERYSPRENIVP